MICLATAAGDLHSPVAAQGGYGMGNGGYSDAERG